MKQGILKILPAFPLLFGRIPFLLSLVNSLLHVFIRHRFTAVSEVLYMLGVANGKIRDSSRRRDPS